MQYIFDTERDKISLERCYELLFENGFLVSSVYFMDHKIYIDFIKDITPQQFDTIQTFIHSWDGKNPIEEDIILSKSELKTMLVNTVEFYENTLNRWDLLTQAELKAVVKRNTQVCYYLLKMLQKEFI